MSGDNDTSYESTDEIQPGEFIQWLLEKINNKLDEDDNFMEKEFYHLLIKRLKFYVKAKTMMENDPLFEKLKDIANDYQSENDELNVSDESALEHAIKQNKAIIMHEIKRFLYNDNDESESEDEEDTESENMSDNESNENYSEMSQTGNGSRTKTDLLRPIYNQK